MTRHPKQWRVKLRRIDDDRVQVTYDDSTGRLGSVPVNRDEDVSRHNFPAYVRDELATWWKS